VTLLGKQEADRGIMGKIVEKSCSRPAKTGYGRQPGSKQKQLFLFAITGKMRNITTHWWGPY